MVITTRHQVWPQLGFYDDRNRRLPGGDEAIDRAGVVIRQIALDNAFAKQLLTGCTASRRHAGQQYPRQRVMLAQRVDQWLRGARLTHRHRVNPDRPPHRICRLTRLTRQADRPTLAPVLPILGLAA